MGVSIKDAPSLAKMAEIKAPKSIRETKSKIPLPLA